MKDYYGVKLLNALRKQREYFYRTIDGKSIITDFAMYNLFEDEAFRLQMIIGKENKKKIIAEYKERRIPVPNFRKEGIAKL